MITDTQTAAPTALGWRLMLFACGALAGCITAVLLSACTQPDAAPDAADAAASTVTTTTAATTTTTTAAMQLGTLTLHSAHD